MSLIPMNEMTVLKSASEVRGVADSAEATLQEMSLAALINNAANTGEYFATWEHPLLDELKEKLEAQGYHVKQDPHAADPSKLWIIRWNS